MSQSKTRRDLRGFTLLELLLAVAILGILLALAIPAYRDLIASQRVKSAISDLNTAMVFARSEAVKRNGVVTLTPAAGGWAAGWRIADPVSDDNPDLLNQTRAGGVGITSDSVGIAFAPSGRTSAAVDFEITSDVNAGATHCLRLGVDGRASASMEEC